MHLMTNYSDRISQDRRRFIVLGNIRTMQLTLLDLQDWIRHGVQCESGEEFHASYKLSDAEWYAWLEAQPR